MATSMATIYSWTEEEKKFDKCEFWKQKKNLFHLVKKKNSNRYFFLWWWWLWTEIFLVFFLEKKFQLNKSSIMNILFL